MKYTLFKNILLKIKEKNFTAYKENYPILITGIYWCMFYCFFTGVFFRKVSEFQN